MLSVSNQQNLNQVLDLLAQCKHLNHLKQLQAILITIGHTQTQFFAFKLVRCCTLVLANLLYARFIFDHLNSPNIYLHAAMITAYASQPDHRSALILYREMVRRGRPRPNHFIYPHVLKCSPEDGGSHFTKWMHAQVLKSGFQHYPVVQTALVDSYSRSSLDIGTARELFDEMSERNVVSWTTMISGYAGVGEMGNAVFLFDKMTERDVPSWNAVIAGCTQNGLFSEAVCIFIRMITSAFEEGDCHIRPNGITVICALSACGHTGMLRLGKWIHGYVYRNTLGWDSFSSNALLDMYGKCGSLEASRRIFNLTREKSLRSWNSMINCYALHGQHERAISVFEEMTTRYGNSLKPDSVTFVGLLNACNHGGLVEKGWFYFDVMTRDYQILPQIEHYGCLIDLLGRAGRFEEAMKVITEMKIRPDEVVWGSLLNGCKIHCHRDMAEFYVKKLRGIDPKNGAYGIMLANLYVESGKWDEARRVRNTLKEQNAYKIPGCSWIEVSNKVHQFYSLDRTHAQTEEIYNILDSLAGAS